MSSTVSGTVAVGDVTPDHHSSASSPLLKLNQQVLALSSPRPSSVSLQATMGMSGHLVVDVQPPMVGTEDGEGSNRPSPDDDDLIGRRRRPAVHQCALAFVDLTYSVKRPRRSLFLRRSRDDDETSTTKTRTRTLLDGVCGEARDGEILGVLGASGAGKTTLIDALADRIQRSSLGGSVTLNGEALDGRLLRAISAYVMQDDLLYPMLTVAETLTYAAELRLPSSIPASEKRSRVQALIDRLGLRAAANTIIGDEGRRGVSGGERRRVSIGADIIHGPVILFLDEPTSGLDSTSAFTVVNALRGIARSGSVVIMSIHQPSNRILGLLSRLLFLSRGRTVYYGPPAGLPLFFSEFGQPIPDGENPAEFALDTIRELEGITAPADGTKELLEFSRSWQEKQRLSSSSSRTTTVTRKAVASSTSYANPWWVEVCVLTRRAFTNTRRTPELYLIRVGIVTLTAFILATTFWQLDDTRDGMTERFAFFVIGISSIFYASADAFPVFLTERHIFLRETARNAYRSSSYTISSAVAALPLLLLLALAFAAITFFAVGLAGGAAGFAFFALVVLASLWAGSGLVTFLSVVVPHVVVGYAVVVGVLAYFMLFSGFYLTRDRIPGYWIWLHYLSLVKYPYQAVMQSEINGAGPARCFVRGVQMFDGTPLGTLPDATKVKLLDVISQSTRMVGLNSSSCTMAGADVLAKQAVTDFGKWACLWVTVAWGFLYRLLFYLTLLLGSNNKRR